MRQFLQKELVEIHGRVEKRRIEKTDIAESFYDQNEKMRKSDYNGSAT